MQNKTTMEQKKYKIYQKQIDAEEYFSYFDNQDTLTEDIKKHLYSVYVIKLEMFHRDNFTCQNKNCKFCHNKKNTENLTRHHVKWQKNGGKDTLRNSLTLCEESHQAYHSGQIDLVISDNQKLPSNIRGTTQKVNHREKILARQKKKAMKKFRKEIIRDINLRENITSEYIIALINFLDQVW